MFAVTPPAWATLASRRLATAIASTTASVARNSSSFPWRAARSASALAPGGRSTVSARRLITARCSSGRSSTTREMRASSATPTRRPRASKTRSRRPAASPACRRPAEQANGPEHAHRGREPLRQVERRGGRLKLADADEPGEQLEDQHGSQPAQDVARDGGPPGSLAVGHPQLLGVVQALDRLHDRPA